MRDMRDKCEICLGELGGVPGNENIVEDVIVCDFCLVKIKNDELEGSRLLSFELHRARDVS